MKFTDEQLKDAAEHGAKITDIVIEALSKQYPSIVLHPEVIAATIGATLFKLSLLAVDAQSYSAVVSDLSEPQNQLKGDGR